MITRTFVDKTNTIISNSKENFGLNPVCSLCYGNYISRILVYFDVEKIAGKVEDGTFKNTSGLTHHLKMTNCGSVDAKKFFEKDEIANFYSQKRRASSFDIIAFKVPQVWDAGDGFDNSTDTWFLGYKSVSTNGSTWEQSMNGVKWQEIISKDDSGGTIINDTPGIYTSDFLWTEYEKWGRGEESIVIGRQHFDYGNENLDIDITNYINDVLAGSKNYGICLAFSPKLEETPSAVEQYINFFSPHTNTFFAPYVETKYGVEINDDRYKFFAGKTNRLYFYSIIGEEFTELDETPICTIDGEEYPVYSDTKGIYYTEVKLPSTKTKSLKYDEWSNLILNGEEIEPVELSFEIHPSQGFFNFGEEIKEGTVVSPALFGINDDQKLNQGDKREITVSFRVPYNSSEYELLDNSFYRIYVKDGKREIDVIDWEPIMTLGAKNLFYLDTTELLPQDYYIDIKTISGRQTLIHKNCLHFRVVDNATEMKR